MRDEITEYAARTLWLCAYADAIDNDEISGPAPGPGGEWDNYAPPTPIEAKTAARKLIDSIDSLETIASRWMLDTGCDLDRFGHCLALQALGHGVGLEDDYPASKRAPRVELPHTEFYIGEIDLDNVEGASWIDSGIDE